MFEGSQSVTEGRNTSHSSLGVNTDHAVLTKYTEMGAFRESGGGMQAS